MWPFGRSSVQDGAVPSPADPATDLGQAEDLHSNRADATSSASTSTQEYYEDISSIRLAQREGVAYRIAAKSCGAALTGFVLGPILSRNKAGSRFAAGALTAIGSASVMAFYELSRESLTMLMLMDSPLVSLMAGSLTGYAWNGLSHGTKAHAVAGAMAVGSLATMLHTTNPNFQFDKFVTRGLLGLDLLDDPDGSLRRYSDSPPVLPPFTLSQTWAWLGDWSLRNLPVKAVSDEEYTELQKRNAPVVLSFRRTEAKNDQEE